MDVPYNDPMYSQNALWNALHADNVSSDFYPAVEIWVGNLLIKLSKNGKPVRL